MSCEGDIGGASFFESPIAGDAGDANDNQSAYLAVWAETIRFPARWVTNPRARWEPVDEHTALLYLPLKEGEGNFLVRFDPQTGLIDAMETMRHRDAGEGQAKVLWRLHHEIKTPLVQSNTGYIGSAMWLDQGAPWAYFTVEELFFDVGAGKNTHQGGY